MANGNPHAENTLLHTTVYKEEKIPSNKFIRGPCGSLDSTQKENRTHRHPQSEVPSPGHVMKPDTQRGGRCKGDRRGQGETDNQGDRDQSNNQSFVLVESQKHRRRSFLQVLALFLLFLRPGTYLPHRSCHLDGMTVAEKQIVTLLCWRASSEREARHIKGFSFSWGWLGVWVATGVRQRCW